MFDPSYTAGASERHGDRVQHILSYAWDGYSPTKTLSCVISCSWTDSDIIHFSVYFYFQQSAMLVRWQNQDYWQNFVALSLKISVRVFVSLVKVFSNGNHLIVRPSWEEAFIRFSCRYAWRYFCTWG